MEARFLTAADAGRILGLTPGAVRMMERRGELIAAEQTEGGVRLFLRTEVQRVRLARHERATASNVPRRPRGGRR